MASNLRISFIYIIITLQIICQITHIRAQFRKRVHMDHRDVINATRHHYGTVIFLHAAGDAGEDCVDQVRFSMPNISFPHLKIAFPTAPREIYNGFDGEYCHVWFNRFKITLKSLEDDKSIERTYRSFKDIIDAEVASGIPLDRIIIGGFGQGGSFALHIGYKYNTDIAGVFAMSAFLSMNSTVYKVLQRRPPYQKLPRLLMTHGEIDTEIPFTWGHLTFNTLHDLGVKGSFYHEQLGVHELSPRQLQKVVEFIEQVLPNPNPYVDPETTTKDDSRFVNPSDEFQSGNY